jgi:alpha-tubulin suppressor-like RCC1 family protein
MARSRNGRAGRGVAGLTLVVAVVGALLVVGPGRAGAAAAVPLSTGSNLLGQLGDPTVATGRPTAGSVAVPQATAIASGRDHAYALDADGRLWGWGENGYGQVGDASTTDRRTPVRLGLTNVVAIEAGHYHGIALRADGTVWTWGYGALGQLGLGTTSNRGTPVQVPGLTGIIAVAAGRDMSYALRSDHTVVAWGSNTLGEVGDGTTTRRLSPVPVPGLTEVVELSGGRNHALARRADGSVWAWGDNQYGQLGDGTTTRRLSPVRLSLGSVAHVDAGAHHSIAVRTDGTVWTWGRGYRGQLGLGSTSNRTSPTVVPGVPAAVEVGDGRDQSFALTASGDVWAWGQNADGQLGDGTTTTRTSPVHLGLTGIVAAQSGSAHTVFLPGEPGSTTTTTTSSTTSSTSTSTTTTSSTSTTTTTTTVPPAGQVGFRAAATASVNATSATVGIPAATGAGDALLLFVTTNSVPTYADPAGWTLVAQQVHTSSSDMLTRMYRRTALASDPGSPVRVTLPTTTKVDLALVAYSGVDPSNPIAQWAVRQETATTTAHTSPGLGTPAAGGWVVTYWAEKTSTTTDWVPPAGAAARTETSGSGSGRIESLLVDTGGAVPATAWAGSTATADSAGRKVLMFSVSLRPAP